MIVKSADPMQRAVNILLLVFNMAAKNKARQNEGGTQKMHCCFNNNLNKTWATYKDFGKQGLKTYQSVWHLACSVCLVGRLLHAGHGDVVEFLA